MFQDEIDYGSLPEGSRGGMRRYVEQGIEPGGFLLAVLQNNQEEAFGRADIENMERMADYAVFLYNYAPRECWGSKEIVEAWMKNKRSAAGERGKK